MNVSKSQRKNLLLEIGCEELPISHQRHIREVFKSGPTLEGIEHGEIRVFTTPRRIVYYIENLSERQKDIERQVFGPPKNKSFDSSGKPTQAATGFAKSLGINANDLKIVEREGGEYIFAKIIEKGEYTYSYLCKNLKLFIHNLTFPKSMRWNAAATGGGTSFSRPIRWILALYGDRVVKFNILGLKSDRFTYGNRLIYSKKIKIEEADIEKYIKALEKVYVIVDHEERKRMIVEQMKELYGYPREGAGTEKIEEERILRELIDEVADLVEYPHAIKCKFPDEYLKLPEELVKTCMMEHEKFFPVIRQDGKLLPNFISIVNNPCLSRTIENTIKHNNENVLTARLADAKFSYERDIKEGLDIKIERLKQIIFQGGMGSLYEKTKRLKELSLFIADRLGIDREIKERILRTTEICKIDIGSRVVNEFPSLQGTMGKIYALYYGEDKNIAQAIYEHYSPRFDLDIHIGTIGAIIGIADRIDNICSFFAQGYKATGSEDPFGARRDAQGLIDVLMHVNDVVLIPLRELVEKELSLIGDKSKSSAKEEILSFLRQRVQTMLKTQKIEYDEADAIIDIAFEKNLCTALERAKVIQKFRMHPEFKKFIIAFKRVVNILEQAGILKETTVPEIQRDKVSEYQKVNEEILKEKEEKKLYEIYLQIKDEIEGKIKNNNFREAMDILLSNLAKPIDNFFDHVLVMTDDDVLKRNRLSLLYLIANLFFLIADFSKIVMSEELSNKK